MARKSADPRDIMKTRPNYVSDGDLQAYVDGLLDANDRSRVESFLSAYPEERERLDAYRRQNILLHQLYDRPAHRPLPSSHDVLVRKLNRKIRLQKRISGGLRMAAAAAIVAVTGGVGWASYDWFVESQTPLLAFSGHGSDSYVMLVDDGRSPAGTERSSEAIARRSAEMLSALSAKQLGMPEQAPNLEKAGFRLIGARTLPTAAGPAIQLLYSSQGEGQLKLFLRANTNVRSSAPTAFDNGQMSVIYSQFDNVAYSLVGNVNRETLLGLAALVSDTFTTANISASRSRSAEESRLPAKPAHKTPESVIPENSEKTGEGVDQKGSVTPDAEPAQPSPVIRTGLKPPA